MSGNLPFHNGYNPNPYQSNYQPGLYSNTPPPAAYSYGFYPPPPQWHNPGPYPQQHLPNNIYHGVTTGGQTDPTPPKHEQPSAYEEIVKWVHTTPSECHKLQGQALQAGREGWDHSPLWICRARVGGDLVPGKIVPKHSVAYVPYDGNEAEVKNVEVLCTSKPENLTWNPCKDGGVPLAAVVGGHTSKREPLYIGRASHMDSITPGKIHQSHRCLYISFGGKEVPYNNYEALCERK